AGAAAAVLGGVVVVAFRAPAPVIAGFALFGAGLATVIPTVFAAAGKVARTPAEGVAGVATITWLSGFVAPPVTGWLAGAVAFPITFALVTGMVAAMIWPARALRPRGAAAYPYRSPRPARADGQMPAVCGDMRRRAASVIEPDSDG
ncbi:MAG: hypothetical protein IRZ07_24685, partial [Microbispora sp.]|nr:hypothetical protein [Microbispora sp.]